MTGLKRNRQCRDVLLVLSLPRPHSPLGRAGGANAGVGIGGLCRREHVSVELHHQIAVCVGWMRGPVGRGGDVALASSDALHVCFCDSDSAFQTQRRFGFNGN